MDRTSLPNRYKPNSEIKCNRRSENEAASFDSRNLRDAARAERRGKRFGGLSEKRSICEKPEYIRMTADPRKSLDKRLGEVDLAILATRR
jgi:hypothetical protein